MVLGVGLGGTAVRDAMHLVRFGCRFENGGSFERGTTRSSGFSVAAAAAGLGAVRVAGVGVGVEEGATEEHDGEGYAEDGECVAVQSGSDQPLSHVSWGLGDGDEPGHEMGGGEVIHVDNNLATRRRDEQQHSRKRSESG